MRLALFSFVLAVLSVQQAVSLPFDERTNKTPPETLVLSLALELEHLEVAFYTKGLKQFSEADFVAANLSALIYRRYQEIQSHEITHAALLTTALGKLAPLPCNYSFPFNSVQTFVSLSLIFESVGASAYTGALQFLTTPEFVTAGAAILSTEARQSTWVGTAVIGVTPWGTPYETPISANEAFTLASGFTTSCPSTNPSLGLQTFPTLNITGTPIPGQNVTVQSPSTSAKPAFIAFSSGLSVQFVPIDASGKVTVPANVSGQVYAVATSSGTVVSASTTIAGPAVLLVETNSNGTLIN